MYQLKPTPRLLTLEGLVAHGYMDQETLDAVIVRIHEIIGEDEEVKPNYSGSEMQGYENTRAEARNDLREQQRSQIK